MLKHFKEIHVVSNTHWDREFRMDFQKSRMALVRMMDGLLDLLERDPNYASYTLDSHAILVEDYLEIRPEARERVKRLVRARRLFVGPWYTLPDIPNIGQEAVVRNLLYGHTVASALGHVMKVGYTPCSWGQTGQLPQIYAGFDIDTILFYRGISPHEAPVEFIWEAPDGTRALGFRFSLFARYNYYYLVYRKITYGLDYGDREWFWGKDGETPFKVCDPQAGIANIQLIEPDARHIEENVVPSIRNMLAIEGGDYVSSHFLAMHGHDYSFPHPLESRAIADANRLQNDVKVIHSDLERYFRKVKAELDFSKLKVLKGERRGALKAGFWTYLFPGTISARTNLKKTNFLTEMKLVHCAEPLAAFTWLLGDAYPARYLDLAWRYLLANHTHDANAGCVADAINDDVVCRYRQSQYLSDALTEEAMKTIVKKIRTDNLPDDAMMLTIFNPLAQRRSVVLPLEIDVPEAAHAQSLVIRDSSGAPCDYQLVETFDTALFADSIYNVPQTFNCRRFKIWFAAENIPPIGYKTYRIEPSAQIDRRSGSLVPATNVLENEFLRVELQPNGTMTLLDKKNKRSYRDLAYFRDQGEVGNAWKHVSPAEDQIITSLSAGASIALVENGPLAATYLVQLEMRLPLEAEGQRRSRHLVSVPIELYVTLKRGARRVELRTRFFNAANDHWLRIVFPTSLKTDVSSADSHFDVVTRPIAIPPHDDWKEPIVGTYPYRTFVSLSDRKPARPGGAGLAVLSEGLQEYEVFDDETRPMAISLVRGVRISLEVAENKKQELPDQGSQCPGWQEFRLALYPHAGNWLAAKCITEALDFTAPVRAAQWGPRGKASKFSATKSASRRRLPWEHGLFELDSEHLILSAVKKAERRNSLILRFYNPADVEAPARLRFFRPFAQAYYTNLNERRGNAITKRRAKELDFTAPPKKIITLEILF